MRSLLVVAALGALLAGCVGDIRDTTTARSAQEQLLCTTAAQRAVAHVDSSRFADRRVWIDADRINAQVDRSYVVSAFEQLVSEAKGRLARSADDADLIVEVRSATLGCWDGDWDIFIPTLYVAGMTASEQLPDMLKIGYSLREGWCRIDAFCYERATGLYVCGWRAAWGRAYVGLFDDVYPDLTVAQAVKAKAE